MAASRLGQRTGGSVRATRPGGKNLCRLDGDYEAPRRDMVGLFDDLGITRRAAAA